MAFLIPSYIQKRLLRYALSHFPVIDTDTLDLEQLDIALGKRSSFELRDVGLHVQKFASILQLPDRLRPTKARIISLHITVPADIYGSGIEVEVQGIDVRFSLDRWTDGDAATTPRGSGKRKRNRAQEPAVEDEDDHIRTAEEMAESFLNEQPAVDRQELEEAIQQASVMRHEDSDDASETSDEDNAGTGVGLEVPAFLANFLKGIIDRLHMAIKNVEFTLDTELLAELSSDYTPVSLCFVVSSVEIEGFTHKTESDSASEDPERRKVRLCNIYGELITEVALFASLEKLSSVGSRQAESTSVSSPRLPEHSRQLSPRSTSSSASHTSHRSQTSLSAASQMSRSQVTASMAASRSSIRPEDRMQSSHYSQDRFADASDDGHEDAADSMHESHFYPPSSLAGSRITPSEFDDDPEAEELPFMMEDAHSTDGYDSQELDPFAAMNDSYNQPRSTSSLPRRYPTYSAATAPMTPLRSSDSYHFDRSRPIYSSHPAPRRRLTRDLQPASSRHDRQMARSPSPSKSDSSGSPSEAAEASLAQSMIYSHEEAQSMYMSAIGDARSKHYDMPGGWGGSTSSDGSQAPRDYQNESCHAGFIPISPEAHDGGVETPRPRSPSNASSSPESKFRKLTSKDDPMLQSTGSPRKSTVSKRLFNVDEIVLWLPWSVPTDGPEAVAAGEAPLPHKTSSTRGAKAMPGAFSQYESVFSQTFRAGTKSTRFGDAPDLAESTMSTNADSVLLSPPKDPDVAVEVGETEVWADTSSARLLFRLVEQVMEVWSAQPSTPERKRQETTTANAMPNCSLKLQAVRFMFMENLRTGMSSPGNGLSDASSMLAEPLLEVEARSLSIANTSAGTTLQVMIDVQSFRAGYPKDPILSFDRASKRQSISRSRIIAKEPDIKVVFKTSPSRGPELDIVTVPALLALNLQKLDDRLQMFGGVSGILDLGSSMASNSTVLGASPAKAKSATVRFGGEPASVEMPTLSPIKINARFYGASLLLKGKSCAVRADTGTLAVIVRHDSARVKIEHIQVLAPFEDSMPDTAAFKVDVFKTDVTFLVSGAEDDFENLVALIEPSSDRYENDDDVLLDMLRRQRKNGSVLRVRVTDVQANVSDLDHVDALEQLGRELGRLSSGVTKYLPEDDRPGTLVLPTISKMHLLVQINDKIGLVEASMSNIQIAHVGTPLLSGFKIGSMSALREGEVLLDALLPLEGKTPTPAAMGRFIGNVPESRIKLKFFNCLVEYRVSTALAILGISGAETVEDLAMNMAASVATLKFESSASQSDDTSPGRATTKSPAQPLRLDVFVRDCALGLNPAKSSAKGLILLSKAQTSVDESAKSGLKVSLELKRSSMLLIDDTSNLDLDVKTAPRPYDSDNLSPAVDDLTKQGYQAVASIWSAQTDVVLSKNERAQTLVDVSLNNKLFTLETCADSQATLVALLGGLAPPLPKEKKEMYRTTVVPIEDMMASFTGEAFVQSKAEIDAVPVDEGLNMEDADQILEDIPSNMDFVGSFYDPEDDSGNYDPSVLGSVNRLSSRILAPAKNDKISFADSIEEKFEHGPNKMLIDPSEDYLEVFKFKAPCRRWNSKSARLEPIYASDTHNCSIKVSAKLEQITYNLHDGYDWAATRDKIAQAVERVEEKIEQRRQARRNSSRDDFDDTEDIEDMLFQSVWIQVPADADERDLRRNINRQIADEYTETGSTRTESVDTRTTGGRPVHRRKKSRTLHLERSRKKISIDLKHTVADFLVLPEGTEETQNSIALRVGNFEIYDHVPSSTWSKFLTYLHDAGEREMGKPMVRLDAVTVKPVADLAAIELIIKAHLLPLRLHVDQDALEFMTRFFDFKDDRSPSSPGEPGPFIARLEVNSIPVSLDYKPHKVDYAGLRSGSTSEFANFVVLDRAGFVLNRIIIYGLKSPDELHPKLKGIWTDDIVRNQLPTVLAGLNIVRPLVDVGSGIRNLIDVPINEYRKDGRVVRSIQKGALAFAKTTTSELARLGARVAIGTQTVLEGAEGLLSPTSEKRSRARPIDDWDSDDFSTSPAKEEPRAVSNYADQPLNVVGGLRNAWQGLERDLTTAKDAIIAIGGDVRESGSAFGAVGAVARLAPTVILRPAIGATRGVGMTLLGAGNMLDKDSRRKIEDKYKRY